VGITVGRIGHAGGRTDAQLGHPAGFSRNHRRTQDNTLTLHQRRFTYLPNDAAQIWMVPVTVVAYAADGTADTQTVLLESTNKPTSPMPPDTTAYKINPGQTGFYHVGYNDAENLARLGGMVARQQLPPMDRWGLQNDLFARVKAGRGPYGGILDMADNYSGEAFLPAPCQSGQSSV
jgi:aminopeptidase N